MSIARSYPWPASRIDRDIMHELHLASRDTGKPITVLIADAVHASMNERLERQATPAIGFATGSAAVPPASSASAA